MTGRKLLHYQILEKLGEGGMGVVYKARDSHLDRFVAIKVLPPEKVADPSRKARFVQEAKAASALNHPNIVTTYDISSDAGHDFIAMEYVAGKTLDQLIPRRGMRLNEALKIAVQIADALARAHAAGIIHRDLKPANIMVDAHGQVKVLDFGLAKLTEQGISEDDSTATKAVETGEGTIVGTAAYMSPEQAEARPVDARSDIFSFGAVLYEMVAGQRAFVGDSKMSTLTAVLGKEPAPLPPEVPHDLTKLIARCLRKDPERRFQHTGDIKVALAELREESDSGALSAAQEKHGRRMPVRSLLSAAAVAVLALGAWLSWNLLKGPAAAPRLLSLTTYPGLEMSPSLSPDGRQVAFSWNGEKQDNEDIYVQLVGAGAPPLRLTSHPAPDRAPVWSPDGAQIAFVRAQAGAAAVYVTPALGGLERKVTDFRQLAGVYSLNAPAVSWSPDGKWLAVPALGDNQTSGVSLVPVEQGEARKLISNPRSEGGHYWPVFSPKGDFLAFSLCSANRRACDLHVLELGADYAPKGQPRRLTRRGALIEGIAWTPDGESLIYSSVPDLASGSHLWKVPVSGGAAPEKLELTGDRALHPTLSKAGNRLVYTRSEYDCDIWKLEDGAVPQRFLSSTRLDYEQEFSPDGTRIAFSSDRSGSGSELWVASRDGTNLVRLAKPMAGLMGYPHWSPDGGRIAFHAQSEDGRWDVYVIDSAGGQPRRLTSEPSDEQRPSWSRDGKWIYFMSNRGGRYDVCRVAPEGGEWVQVTNGGGNSPIESRDGKTLFYEKASRLIARQLASGEERTILDHAVYGGWSVVEDGVCYVARSGGTFSFGFEIRCRDFTKGDDVLVHKSDLNFALGLTATPDRKTILFAAGTGQKADLVLVENFR